MLKKIIVLLGLFALWVLATPLQAETRPVNHDWVWQAPLPFGSSSNTAACLSDNFCIVAGGAGSIYHWNGETWLDYSFPEGYSHSNFYNLNCVTSSFCMLVGDEGIWQWDGFVWQFSIANTTDQFLGLSCVSSSFCMASDHSQIYVWQGSSWTISLPNTSQTMYSVDCLSATLCFTAGENGFAWQWNGTAWASITPAEDTIFEISCVSATSCYAALFEDMTTGSIIHWNGSTWAEVYAGVRMEGIECVDPTLCIAVGIAGTVLMGSGQSWTTHQVTYEDTFRDVTCITANNCLVVGFDGALQKWDGTTWHNWTETTFSGDLKAIKCLNETFCAAVGKAIYMWDGISWQPASILTTQTGIDLRAVDCATETNCIAVGQESNAWRWDGVFWQEIESPGDAYELNCPAVDHCFTVVYEGPSTQLKEWDGISWSNFTQPLPYMTSIDCLTLNDCYAAGLELGEKANTVYIYHWDGALWDLVYQQESYDESIRNLECWTPSFCLGQSDFYLYQFDGTSWTTVSLEVGLYAVSCVDSQDCTALGGEQIWLWDGSTWVGEFGWPLRYAWGGDISCSSDGYCAAVGGEVGIVARPIEEQLLAPTTIQLQQVSLQQEFLTQFGVIWFVFAGLLALTGRVLWRR